jgi:Protein of unknown function (DUF3500)
LPVATTVVGRQLPDREPRPSKTRIFLVDDETWFVWMGGTGPTDPFYYRLHSPVVLIEFEHLPGVAFDNPEPSRHHIHTVIRTPSGGDYGADLLAEHHTRFNH